MKDPRFGSCDYVFLCAPVEINLECLAYLKEIRALLAENAEALQNACQTEICV